MNSNPVNVLPQDSKAFQLYSRLRVLGLSNELLSDTYRALSSMTNDEILSFEAMVVKLEQAPFAGMRRLLNGVLERTVNQSA